MDNLSLTIEALIFSSQNPISILDIKQILEDCYEVKYTNSDIEEALSVVISKYESPDFAIEVAEIAEGFTFMSKPIYHHAVATMLKQTEKKRLSGAALETLSIISSSMRHSDITHYATWYSSLKTPFKFILFLTHYSHSL